MNRNNKFMIDYKKVKYLLGDKKYNDLKRELESNNNGFVEIYLSDKATKPSFVFNNINNSIADIIKKQFGVSINSELINTAINGQGSEKEKIDKLYSSSLQSLVIFGGISENNKIKIDGVEYDDVLFEFQNKVIDAPSSVDVVLVGHENGLIKNILFIESKLFEIIDSSSSNGTAEISPTYFTSDLGYKKLGIDYSEEKSNKLLNSIGIKVDCNQEFKKDYIVVKPLGNKKLVYSYGIKQILSHLVGIVNFKNKEYYNESNRKRIEDKGIFSSDLKISFCSIHNELPNLDTGKSGRESKKINNFEAHVKQLIKSLNEFDGFNKNKIKLLEMSYQKLFEDNETYFSDKDEIVSFYHLNQK